MISAKRWLNVFFGTCTLLFLSFYSFIIISEAQYPMRISDSVSFDEKLRFLKNTGLLSRADTVVVGSSMGLYNLDDELLEQKSIKVGTVANISSWGLQTQQVEKLLQLLDVNADIQYVIYPTQVLDYAFDKKLDLDFDEINKYIQNEFTFYMYNRVFLNAFNFLKALYNFKSYHLTEDTYQSLLFGRTGGIVYRIYGDRIDPERWDDTRVFGLNQLNFTALTRIAEALKARGIQFIVVTTPVRQVLLDNNPPMMQQYHRYAQKMRNLAKNEAFAYLNLHEMLALKDAFFADSSHLNAEGAALASNAVARFIDNI